MVRKQLYIGRQQQKTLTRLARTQGKSEAEIMRDALDEYERLQDRRAAWQDILFAVENTMKRSQAGVNEPRTWKREDLYQRGKRSGRHKRPGVPL